LKLLRGRARSGVLELISSHFTDLAAAAYDDDDGADFLQR
jgi:hypothetical protein